VLLRVPGLPGLRKQKMEILMMSRYGIPLVYCVVIYLLSLFVHLVNDEKKMKKSVIVKAEKTGTGKEDKVQKERNVYDLPGQKHDPPAEV
jgi:hypothetical protein